MSTDDKVDGIRCSQCGSGKTWVKDSRPSTRFGDLMVIRRRRRCDACRHTFSTYEIRADDLDAVPDVGFKKAVDALTMAFTAFRLAIRERKSIRTEE